MDHNYANAYMKITTNALQEHVQLLLHSKTQNIVNGEIISSLQMQIEQLNAKINELIGEIQNKDSAIVDRNNIQAENNTLRNKAASLDTAISQINDMKKIIHARDEYIRTLEEKNKELSVDIENSLSSAIPKNNRRIKNKKFVSEPDPIPESILTETQDF